YSVCGTIQDNGDVAWGTKRSMNRAAHGYAGPALVLYGGTIWCVYVTPDGKVKSTTWDKVARDWTTDQDVGTAHSDARVAVAVLNDVLYCLHRGVNDEQLRWCTTTGSGWSGDNFLGAVKSASGPGAIVYQGTLYALLRSRPPAHLLQGSTFITPGGGV